MIIIIIITCTNQNLSKMRRIKFYRTLGYKQITQSWPRKKKKKKMPCCGCCIPGRPQSKIERKRKEGKVSGP